MTRRARGGAGLIVMGGISPNADGVLFKGAALKARGMDAQFAFAEGMELGARL